MSKNGVSQDCTEEEDEDEEDENDEEGDDVDVRDHLITLSLASGTPLRARRQQFEPVNAAMLSSSCLRGRSVPPEILNISAKLSHKLRCQEIPNDGQALTPQRCQCCRRQRLKCRRIWHVSSRSRDSFSVVVDYDVAHVSILLGSKGVVGTR